MLEDRKFYFFITPNYAPYKDLQNTEFPVVGASPWEIIGDGAAVTMVKAGAFVGEHSPRINAGAGIRQRDLGLVAGKNYAGYLWARPYPADMGNFDREVEVTLVWGEEQKTAQQ
jgi:alpha-N-arabinofuranosidase